MKKFVKKIGSVLKSIINVAGRISQATLLYGLVYFVMLMILSLMLNMSLMFLPADTVFIYWVAVALFVLVSGYVIIRAGKRMLDAVDSVHKKVDEE